MPQRMRGNTVKSQLGGRFIKPDPQVPDGHRPTVRARKQIFGSVAATNQLGKFCVQRCRENRCATTLMSFRVTFDPTLTANLTVEVAAQ